MEEGKRSTAARCNGSSSRTICASGRKPLLPFSARNNLEHPAQSPLNRAGLMGFDSQVVEYWPGINESRCSPPLLSSNDLMSRCYLPDSPRALAQSWLERFQTCAMSCGWSPGCSLLRLDCLYKPEGTLQRSGSSDGGSQSCALRTSGRHGRHRRHILTPNSEAHVRIRQLYTSRQAWHSAKASEVNVRFKGTFSLSVPS